MIFQRMQRTSTMPARARPTASTPNRRAMRETAQPDTAWPSSRSSGHNFADIPVHLPDALRAGVERLSGLSMGDVRVHYNSAAPARMHAHAYATGADIHVAAGQEKHLPHEAWHVVQQREGRVQPTMQMAGVDINDDAGLEAEADRMGDEALRHGG